MNKEEYQDYKLEIEELTELLNTEWLDLKNLILSKNINLSNTLLVGYYEDEEGVEYGLLYNKNERQKLQQLCQFFRMIKKIINSKNTHFV